MNHSRALGPIVLLLGLYISALQTAYAEDLFNFVKPLDAVQVSVQGAFLPSQTGEDTASGEILRRITFGTGVQPSLLLSPKSGVWDWSAAGAMSLRIQNAMDWAITLQVRIESSDGAALTTQIALPAGPAQTLLVPLKATTPMAWGMHAAPPMPWTYQERSWLLAERVEGTLSSQAVTAVTISMQQPDSPQSILLGRFGVQREDLQAPLYSGLVDAFGQYSRASWPEKVSSQAELLQRAEQERHELKDWLQARPKTDPYGGFLTQASPERNGFFKTIKQQGRWYFLTPHGHPFFSLGVNAVNAEQSQTYIEGREAMFLDLPEATDPLGAFYGTADHRSQNGANHGRAFDHGRWFDFYAANRYRIHGTHDLAQWRSQALDRLQAWGFNTLGNWSDLGFIGNQRVPYSIALSISGDFASIRSGQNWWGGMPDPFDPRFAMAAERAIAIAARDVRHDPWLLGFFADNELSWAAPGADPKARYALAYATLGLTTDIPAKRAFLKQLRDKYRNQAGLSQAWGIDLPAWELMEDPGFQAPLPSPEHPEIERDLQNFVRLYADTYFKTIAESLQWHAPNHLFLGGRFSITTPEVIASCVQYCDVLSFNRYTLDPNLGLDWAALAALDKPVLISEFHMGSTDRGPFWGGLVSLYHEQERGPAYAQYLRQAVQIPQLVGVHWFEYLDQPVTGRLLDGENGHLGLVGSTDLPFRDFVQAVRAANYAVLRNGLPPVKAPKPPIQAD